MKKINALLIIAVLVLAISSCEKDETTPDTPTTTNPTDTTGNGGSGGGGGTGGDTTVIVANVNGLVQNHIKADGRSEEFLNTSWIGGYNSNGDDYYTLQMFGDNSHYFTITIKGSTLREGNFSLKKYRLLSPPGPNEATIEASINGNLLDFESTDANSISIQLDTRGFYVIKLAPIVGINRNSWDDVITEPISVHAVSNNSKIITSNPVGDVFSNDKYSYNTGFHSISNQPSATLSVLPITLNFTDYDFSSITSIPKTTYPLSMAARSQTDMRNGTSPKGVHIEYMVNFRGWTQNYNKNQSIEMELTPTTIVVTFTDIEFVNPLDSTQTKIASGQWEMAR